MASRVGDVTVRLRADTSQFQRSMRGVTRVMGPLVAIFSVGAIAKGIFNTTREFQRLEAQLKTVTGSAANASRAFKNLEKFAKETPFQVEENVEAFIRLRALGLEPTNEVLKDFGNIASGMGRRITDFARAVQGAVTGETEALKSFGIVSRIAGDEISFIFDGVTRTVKRDSGEIVQALRDISQENFAGAMANEMNTLNGKISNLGDNLASLARTIGAAVTPALGGMLDILNKIVAKTDELAKGVQGLFPGFEFGDVPTSLEAIKEEQASIARRLGTRLTTFQQLTDAAGVRGRTMAERVQNARVQTGGDVQFQILAAAAAIESLTARSEELEEAFNKVTRQTEAEAAATAERNAQLLRDFRRPTPGVVGVGRPQIGLKLPPKIISEDIVPGFERLEQATRDADNALDETAQATNAFASNMVGQFSGMFGSITSGMNQMVQSALRALAALAASQIAGPIGGVIGSLFGAPHVGRRPVAATPVIAMNVNVSGAGNPLAMARDAQWQTALRESLLVANQGGFRIG